MALIDFNPFEQKPAGSGLTELAKAKRAQAMEPAQNTDALAHRAGSALSATVANLSGGENEAGRLAGDVAGFDTAADAEKAGSTLEGAGLDKKLDSTLPAHPGEAQGPPPGNYLADQAQREAGKVSGEIDRKHGQAPRPGDDEDPGPPGGGGKGGKEGEE